MIGPTVYMHRPYKSQKLRCPYHKFNVFLETSSWWYFVSKENFVKHGSNGRMALFLLKFKLHCKEQTSQVVLCVYSASRLAVLTLFWLIRPVIWTNVCSPSPSCASSSYKSLKKKQREKRVDCLRRLNRF